MFRTVPLCRRRWLVRLRPEASLLAADAGVSLGAPSGIFSGSGGTARRQADGPIRDLPGNSRFFAVASLSGAAFEVVPLWIAHPSVRPA